MQTRSAAIFSSLSPKNTNVAQLGVLNSCERSRQTKLVTQCSHSARKRICACVCVSVRACVESHLATGAEASIAVDSVHEIKPVRAMQALKAEIEALE